MNRLATATRFRTPAFSLLELLIVISIIGILSVIAIGSLSSGKRSSELQTGASAVLDYLTLARQTAMAGNRPVTVRIYLWDQQAGAWKSQNPIQRDSIRLFRRNSAGTADEEVERVLNLPDSSTFSADNTFSSILSTSISGPTATDARGIYRSFRFMPDGSIDCAGSTSPTLTLLYRIDAAKTSLANLNFVTLQVDLQTGAVRLFRPS